MAYYITVYSRPCEMLCSIWYHLYNLRNVKNIQGGVLLLVKLEALGCNFTKSNNSPWMFFAFLKLYKWRHHIAQRITNDVPLEKLYYFCLTFVISIKALVKRESVINKVTTH